MDFRTETRRTRQILGCKKVRTPHVTGSCWCGVYIKMCAMSQSYANAFRTRRKNKEEEEEARRSTKSREAASAMWVNIFILQVLHNELRNHILVSVHQILTCRSPVVPCNLHLNRISHPQCRAHITLLYC